MKDFKTEAREIIKERYGIGALVPTGFIKRNKYLEDTIELLQKTHDIDVEEALHRGYEAREMEENEG